MTTPRNIQQHDKVYEILFNSDGSIYVEMIEGYHLDGQHTMVFTSAVKAIEELDRAEPCYCERCLNKGRQAMTITFKTDKYESSHGRKPAGNKKGAWAFEIRSDDDHLIKKVISTPGIMSLREAKATAEEVLRRNNIDHVEVQVAP